MIFPRRIGEGTAPRCLVHALIRRLGGQNDRNEQGERVGIDELGLRRGGYLILEPLKERARLSWHEWLECAASRCRHFTNRMRHLALRQLQYQNQCSKT